MRNYSSLYKEILESCEVFFYYNRSRLTAHRAIRLLHRTPIGLCLHWAHFSICLMAERLQPEELLERTLTIREMYIL